MGSLSPWLAHYNFYYSVKMLSTELKSVGAPAPAVTKDMPADKAAVLNMDVTTFSTEELETRVEKLYSLQDMVGILRAKYLREIRDRKFPLNNANGGSTQAARMGWAEYVSDKFGAEVQRVNREIDGLAAIEAAQSSLAGKTDQNSSSTGAGTHRSDFNSTELIQLGTAKPEARSVLAESLLTGEIAGKRQIKAAEKELTTVVVTPQPPSMKKAPKTLKINESNDQRAYSLAKWRKVPEVKTEQEWMQKHLKKMKTAAKAYQLACRALNKRFEDKQAENRNWPTVVTVMAEVWKESDFNFDTELQEISKFITDGDRDYEQAMALCHGAANIVD